MLSPLQEQVAELVASLDEAKEFALAGGAALIARGDVERRTRDLDFFGLSGDAVDRLVPAVARALREAGLVVHHIQENPGFARLMIERAMIAPSSTWPRTPDSSPRSRPGRPRC